MDRHDHPLRVQTGDRPRTSPWLAGAIFLSLLAGCSASGASPSGAGGFVSTGATGGGAGTSGTGGSGAFAGMGPVIDAGSSDAPESGCTAVDLLFVIDNSGSMGFYQEQLAKAFPGFVDAMFANLPPSTDLHVGITTTDGLYGASCGEGTSNCQSNHAQTEIDSNFTPPDKGNNGINGGQGRLYEYQQQYFYATNTAEDKTGLKQWFSGAATAAGEDGCSIEMASAAAGLVAHPANGPTNKGFIRDMGAVLVVFVLSDEPDKSPEPVSTYVDMLVTTKAACGGLKCILSAGIVGKTCYNSPVDPTLKTFLESFGTPAAVGDIGLPLPGGTAPDYSAVVGDALAKVIKQKCDEIEPPH